jgi:hypothetical protein
MLPCVGVWEHEESYYSQEDIMEKARIPGHRHEDEIKDAILTLTLQIGSEIEHKAESIGTTGEMLLGPVTERLRDMFRIPRG